MYGKSLDILSKQKTRRVNHRGRKKRTLKERADMCLRVKKKENNEEGDGATIRSIIIVEVHISFNQCCHVIVCAHNP